MKAENNALCGAELFWVARDMVDVSMYAASTLPECYVATLRRENTTPPGTVRLLGNLIRKTIGHHPNLGRLSAKCGDTMRQLTRSAAQPGTATSGRCPADSGDPDTSSALDDGGCNVEGRVMTFVIAKVTRSRWPGK